MKYFWALIIGFVISSVGAFENKVIDTLIDGRSERMSDKCNHALDLYLQNLKNSTTDDKWALKMLDATSKIPVGLLFSYNLGELGEFNQCLDTESQDGLIKGKYCLGSISLGTTTLDINETDLIMLHRQVQLREAAGGITNMPTRKPTNTFGYSPSWAICLPSDCTDDDVGEILLHLIGSPGVRCQTKEDLSPPLTNGAIATIVILAFFAAMLVVSTICDLYYIHIKKEPPHDILTVFSVYKNGRKLFKISKNSAELSCLNGIRFLSMLWVIIGHIFSSEINAFPVSNFKDILDWADSLQSMIFLSGTLSVDSFFLIGGALVVYGFMKAKYNGVKFNVFYFYLHRYLRLTPPLAAAVLVSANLLIYMGSGPHWSSVDTSLQQPCQKYWWTTLLYVQTYANGLEDGMCLGQTWYLNVDMHLYILSPLILLPLWRYPKIGVALILSLILAFIIIPFYIAYDLELAALLTNLHPRTSTLLFMQKYYLKTHTRAAPWIIGALLGYILAKIQFSTDKKLRITKLGKPLVFILWAICIAVTFTCIYAGHSTLRGEEYDRWGNAAYIGLVRPVWSICLAWVILACVTGYGGPINVLLSFPVYQVLNRFTYSIYLLHLTIINMIGYASKEASYFSVFNLAYSFWGLTMFSFGLSILWVLAFESPMIFIEKLIFKGINSAVSKISVCAVGHKSQKTELGA